MRLPRVLSDRAKECIMEIKSGLSLQLLHGITLDSQSNLSSVIAADSRCIDWESLYYCLSWTRIVYDEADSCCAIMQARKYAQERPNAERL